MRCEAFSALIRLCRTSLSSSSSRRASRKKGAGFASHATTKLGLLPTQAKELADRYTAWTSLSEKVNQHVKGQNFTVVDCAQVMAHVTLLEGTSDFASAATVQSRALTMTELWQTTYASFRGTVKGPASQINEILKKFCALEAPCTLTWEFSEAAWIRDDAQRAETKEACSVLTSLLEQALPNLRALQALQKLVTWDETISQEIQDLIACLDDVELRGG